ncbi:DNA repair exonuclease [Microaerobacter geothermalis]|uniref:metallophosphoesterase family protein n=1 Tax=Microaerobacter geothermalis TaxID=674972 RepID=UPI001F3263E8|nr:DNA repair exonuclease [Microaerobacter geothermalis]MCF6094718.1 DNA repair exonuclease [Microaerobacter geothermalis]
MEGFRFVHAADLHLDSPFQGLSSSQPEHIKRVIRQSTFQSFDQLIQLCVDEHVDFLLIAGDVYDGADRSLQAQLYFKKGMERLNQVGIQVFLVHGNHDPEDGKMATLTYPENLHVFPSDKVSGVPFCKGGQEVARIYGISYPRAKVTENLAALFRREEDVPYAIGLLHANVDSSPEHGNYAPCSINDLVAAQMDYWALGHIHHRQILRQDPPIVYPGNIQGRSVKELGSRGCYLVDVSADGKVKLDYKSLDSIRWFVKGISIQGLQTEEELLQQFSRIIEETQMESEGKPAIVRWIIEGKGRLHQSFQDARFVQDLLEEIRLQGDGFNFVWAESIHVKTGQEVNKQEIMKQEHVLGEFLRHLHHLKQNDEELKSKVEEMLHPVLGNRKIQRYVQLEMDEMKEWLEEAEELAIEWLWNGDDE